MTVKIYDNAYKSSPNSSNRVLFIGDSLTMRAHISFTGITVASISATDVTLTHSNASPTVGDAVRFYNQSDREVAYTDATVLSNNGSQVVVRFPFSVAGRISGTTSYFVHQDLLDTGWQNWAKWLMSKGGRYLENYCYANGGATTSQMVQSLEWVPNIENFDHVCVLGGINDLTSSDDPLPIIANLELIYNYFLDRGKNVIACTTWPVMSGDARDTPAKIQAIKDINTYIRDNAGSDERITLVDHYTAIKDPATEYASTGYLIPSDVHQMVGGAQVLGKAFVTQAGKLFYRNTALTNASGVNYRYKNPKIIGPNLLLNPEFTGTGGAKTGATWVGNMPDNWNGTQTGGTSTITTSARADGLGNKLRVQKAATSSNVTGIYQTVTSVVEAGKRYAIGFDYSTIEKNTGQYFRAYLVLTVGGVQQTHYCIVSGLSYASSGRIPDTGTEYHMFSDSFVMPSGVTQALFYYAFDNGASGSTTIEVAAPYLCEVKL